MDLFKFGMFGAIVHRTLYMSGVQDIYIRRAQPTTCTMVCKTNLALYPAIEDEDYCLDSI